MRRRTVVFLIVVLAFVLLLSSALRVGALAPGNEYFQRTWARTDQPVASGQVSRTWMWGPDGFTGELSETYAEAPGGQRRVQYFDKARMEITNPAVDANSIWYVTNGLLVVELVTGQMQTGDASFSQRQPATVNVAGDADDPTGPTYATFGALLNAAPAGLGASLTNRVSRSGQVTVDLSLTNQGLTVAVVDEVTNHAIAAPFWNFMISAGTVWDGTSYIQAALFENAYFATGRPITEPYWANVKVGGTYQDVLMQCFERRCLTYNPANAPEWRVEAGNVGQHYHAWRYQQPADGQTPTATQPAQPSPTATEAGEPLPTATEPEEPSPTATQVEEPTTRYVFDFAFGELYVPTARLKQPRGIGFDPAGNVWIADTANDRLVAFDADGRYVSSFGVSGTEAGQIRQPWDVAFDSTGSSYIADTSNSRIQKFNQNKQFVKLWGSYGTADGQFKNPMCVEVHNNVVYVCDTSNNRIQRFSTDGDYLGQWGTNGVGPGQFKNPEGIAFDADGNIYVADASNRRIQKFNASFAYVMEFGDAEGPGQIEYPHSVAVDGNFNVYAINGGNEIVVFAPDGDFLKAIGQQGSGLGKFNSVLSIDLDPDGNLYAVDDGYYYLPDELSPQVQKFAPDGTPLWRITDGTRFRFAVPFEIAITKSGELAISDSPNDGFGRLAFWSLNGDPGEDIRYFNDPTVPSAYTSTGVAVAPDGDLYVADAFQHNIWHFSADREFIDRWGTFGSAAGQFDGPLGIAVDAAGDVYVVDQGNSRVQKFTSTGVLLDAWGAKGAGDGQFSYPIDIAIYGERVYVTESNNHRVQVFDREGNYLDKWGAVGAGPGEFNYPAGIAVDTSGYVYVVDGDNNRIQKFTPQGEHLATFGLGGVEGLSDPWGIAVASDGRVYVVDTGNQRVVVFSPDD